MLIAYSCAIPDLISYNNYNFKSFVHLSYSELSDVWYSNHEYKDLVKTNYGTFDKERYNKIPVFDKAWIDHFFTKSWEEWVWKLNVRGDLAPGNRKILDFFRYNQDLLPEKEKLLKDIQ